MNETKDQGSGSPAVPISAENGVDETLSLSGPEFRQAPEELAEGLRRLQEAYPPVSAIVKRAGSGRGALLPVLHETQRIYGYLPLDSLDLIAHALGVPRGQTHWVATVLVPFRFEPGPKHVLRACRGTTCQSDGSGRVIESIKEFLCRKETVAANVWFQELTCMGCCGRGPNVMLNGATYSEMNPEKTVELLQELERERSLEEDLS